MRILAVESSAVAASVAVWDDGKMLASFYQNNGLTHSATLMAMIEGMLKNASIPLSSVSLIAVAKGPGSFTGLRIGVAAAKGLSWASDKPCRGVSTLEAMAENVAHMGQNICAVMDARCGQVYNALFETDGVRLTRLCPDRAISLEKLKNEVLNSKKSYILVGDGSELCYNDMGKEGIPISLAPAHLRYQNAWGVAVAAYRAVDSGEAVGEGELKPVYLRLSQAERERQRLCRNL